MNNLVLIQVDLVFLQDATPAAAAKLAAGGLTGPSPDKMTFSAKKRFFEKEIEESVQPTAKTEKRFSFLSEDEVNKLRQEEGIHFSPRRFFFLSIFS